MNKRAAPAYRFRWEGVGARGLVRGELRGPSAAWVRATLRRRGIRDARVRRVLMTAPGLKPCATPQELSLFSRQLAAMLGAGTPMAAAIDTLLLHCPRPAMQTLLGKVRDDIESGSTLGAALAAHPRTFTPLYLGLVRAGELAGVLDQALVQLAAHLDKTIAIRKKVRAAMLYPAVIVVVAVTVTALMMGFVIPRFETMFHHYGAELPPLTRIVLGCSRALREYGAWVLLPAVGCGFAAAAARRRDPRFRHLLDALLLRLPLAGSLARKAVLARVAHTLAAMLEVGVPLLEALPSLAAVAGNSVYHDALLQTATALSGGRSLEASLRATGVFPGTLLQMVQTGEESGKLDEMLRRAGELLETELDGAVATLSALLEPLVIAILGVLIGLIVVAMYLPVFRIASVF